MIKKIVYIGIALLAVAVVLIILSVSVSSSFQNSLQSTLITENLTISSNSYASIQVNATNTTYIFIIGLMNHPANFYFFNSTGYQTWRNYMDSSNSPSGIQEATKLEKSGTLVIYHNVENATVPEDFNLANAMPTYSVNLTAPLPGGAYYAVVDNTNGSDSSSMQILSRVVYLPPITNSSLSSGALSGLANSVNQEVILGLFFFLFFIAGIAVLVYGIMKKPKEATAQQMAGAKQLDTNIDQKHIDELYKSVEKRKSSKKRKRLNT